MSDKLFEIRIRLYVVATTEWMAHVVVDRAFSQLTDSDVDIEIDETKIVNSYWLDTVPHGKAGGRTCREILETSQGEGL